MDKAKGTSHGEFIPKGVQWIIQCSLTQWKWKYCTRWRLSLSLSAVDSVSTRVWRHRPWIVIVQSTHCLHSHSWDSTLIFLLTESVNGCEHYFVSLWLFSLLMHEMSAAAVSHSKYSVTHRSGQPHPTFNRKVCWLVGCVDCTLHWWLLKM